MPTLNETTASTPANLPMLLSQSHLARALGDTRFFEQVPEFRPLQAKARTMHADLDTKRGCGSCNKRRAANTMFADFTSIVRALGGDGRNRLKAYYGVNAIALNTVAADGHVSLQLL
jgi:hypothetical protein